MAKSLSLLTVDVVIEEISVLQPRNPAHQIAEWWTRWEEHPNTIGIEDLADVGLAGFPSVGKSTILSLW